MRCAILLSLICLVLLPEKPALGQQAADPSARYFRLICLVHLTGSGKREDPVRPEFVNEYLTAEKGVVAWSTQPTDNKNMILLHIVATTRKAFEPILNDKRGDIKAFEIGRSGKGEIEGEMKKYKKDFALESFEVIAR
jgi:hypothetical protein